MDNKPTLSKSTNEEDFARPDGLSEDGNKAYDLVSQYLKDNKLTFTGGCKLFHSPAEWDGDYGRKSVLIVVYEGAAAGRALSYDKAYEYARPGVECYALLETLQEKLREAGLFFEQCTTFYSAIYKIK